MKKKSLRVLCCLAIMTTTMTGCGGPNLDSTSVYVYKNGNVASAVYEDFDTSAYSEDDLKAYVEEAVKAYNENTCGVEAAYEKDTKEDISVAIDSLKEESGQAILKMSYASCDDYLAFNTGDESLIQLESGSINDIDLSEYDFSYVDADGESYTDEIPEDAYVVLAEGNKDILVEGKIVCVSEGITVTDKKASVPEDGGLCAIIFK